MFDIEEDINAYYVLGKICAGQLVTHDELYRAREYTPDSDALAFAMSRDGLNSVDTRISVLTKLLEIAQERQKTLINEARYIQGRKK